MSEKVGQVCSGDLLSAWKLAEKCVNRGQM